MFNNSQLYAIFKLVKEPGYDTAYIFDRLCMRKDELSDGIYTSADGSSLKLIHEMNPKTKEALVENDGKIFFSNHGFFRCSSEHTEYIAYGFPLDKVMQRLFNETLDYEKSFISFFAICEGLMLSCSPHVSLGFSQIDFSNVHLKSINEIKKLLSDYDNIPFNFSLKSENERSVKDEALPHQSTNHKHREKSEIFRYSVNDIIGQIKEKIVGQDEAVEAIVSNIYANQKLIDTGNHDLITSQKTSILLDGPTGTGKTAIIKEISDKLSIPFILTNSTIYSGTGYVGGHLTDILVSLLDKTNGDLELAQRGIVGFDEIDKLVNNPNGNSNLEMKEAVQQSLLSFISGSVYDIEYKEKIISFDTSNLTFIGIGAFTELREEKKTERLYNSKSRFPVGFASSIDSVKPDNDDSTYVITPQDFVSYGLSRELIGRFSLLVSTRSYSVEDYKNILLHSSISPLKMFSEFVKSFGLIGVFFENDFIQAVAEKAYRDNFGVRGLQKIFSDLKNSLLLNIINGNNKRIVLTADMIKRIEDKNIRTY